MVLVPSSLPGDHQMPVTSKNLMWPRETLQSILLNNFFCLSLPLPFDVVSSSFLISLRIRQAVSSLTSAWRMCLNDLRGSRASRPGQASSCP